MAETRGGKSTGDAAAGDGAAGSTANRVVIKKYANRRLYNTARSSYVTLEDLARMVRAGEDFAVFDAKTGDDITRSVLTQIIVEEEGRDQNMLPTNFLRQLIRLYGDPLQGVVPSYLDAAMEAFTRNQEQMRRTFAANPLTNPMANLEQMTRSNMELFERSLRMFSPFGAGAGGTAGGTAGGGGAAAGQASGQGAAGQAGGGRPGPAPGPTPQGGATVDPTDDLEGLQKQLREMQAQLERLSRKKG